MTVRIETDIPRGSKQRLVLDHFNASLRKLAGNSTGSAGYRDDGFFISTSTCSFPVDEKEIILEWTVLKDDRGTLKAIEVSPIDSDLENGEWEKKVYSFITSVFSAALADTKKKYFRRHYFYYIGTQLDGEYWLPGFRFSPAYPEDPSPSLINAERVVTIDFNINAIDDKHVFGISAEFAKRCAARLSLLLNVGLYEQQHHHRWVIVGGEADSDLRSERHQLGFSMRSLSVDKMPSKGEHCKLGEYAGSLSALYRVAGKPLSLPPETRKILRGLDLIEPHIADAFDRCARLYQVAAIVGHQFPSVGLAYRVAAVDALTQNNRDFKGFSDFIRQNVTMRSGLDKALDLLHGSLRSAHFHAGEFPMGEYSAQGFFDPLMDSEDIERHDLQQMAYKITREAIINWINNITPELESEKQ